MLKRLLYFALFTNTCSIQAQFAGNALDFDGTDDMVVSSSVPSIFSSPATNDFTIEAWVNPRGSLFARILYAEPSTTNFVSLGTNTGNTIYFYVISNGTTYSSATTGSINQINGRTWQPAGTHQRKPPKYFLTAFCRLPWREVLHLRAPPAL